MRVLTVVMLMGVAAFVFTGCGQASTPVTGAPATTVATTGTAATEAPPATTVATTGPVSTTAGPATTAAGVSQGVLTGAVTFRNRDPLPAGAVIEVTLWDVTAGKDAAEAVETLTIEAGGKEKPFPFELKYDPATIDPANAYALGATITDGTELLFTSDASDPVLTKGAPATDVQVVVLAMSR